MCFNPFNTRQRNIIIGMIDLFSRPVTIQYLHVTHIYVKISVDMLTNSQATREEMIAIFTAALEARQIGTYEVAATVTSEDT